MGTTDVPLPAGTRVAETPSEAVSVLTGGEAVRCVVCSVGSGPTEWAAEAVERVRNADATVPILVVSEATDGDLAIDVGRAGADEYVSQERLETDGETVADRVRAVSEGDARPANIELREQAVALERLAGIIADRSRSFEEKVGDVLELGCERLGLGIGYLSEIDGDRFSFTQSRGLEALLEAAGTDHLLSESVPLETTYCRRVVDSGDVSGFAVGVEGTPWEDTLIRDDIDFGTYLGGPVVVDGDIEGTLCFADGEPRSTEFSDAEQTFVEVAVEWVSQEFERRTYWNELQETTTRLERTFDRISDAVFALDENWSFTYLNGQAETLLDREADELVGKNVWEEFSEALGQQYEHEYRRAMETQEPVTFEDYYEPLDLWTEVNAYPSEDGLSVFFRDITKQKRREQVLRGLLETSRALFRTESQEAIAETVVDATEDILDIDISGVHLYDDGTGTLQSAAASTAVFELVGEPPTYEVGEGLIGSVFESGEPKTYDDIERIDAYDYGSVRSAIAVPMGDHGVLSVGSETPGAFDGSDESVVELLATTAAAALDRAARLSTLKTYETVLESTEDMIYLADADGRITYLTAPLAEWLGYDREDLVGESVTSVFPDAKPTGEAATDGQRTIEATAHTAGGDPRLAEVTVAPLENGGVVASVDDIRELAATKAELSTERDRFAELFERIPDPVVEATIDDEEVRIEGVNSAFESVFGYESSSVVGQKAGDVIVPESRAETADELREMLKSDGVATREIRRRTVSGPRQFLFRGFVYQTGETDHVFGIYTDITEQNERERYLRVTNRILRHNLRNDLNVVRGFAELLAAELDDPEHVDYAERIFETADELVSLAADANELRNVVGRNVGPGLEEAALAPFVERVSEQLKARYPSATIDRSVPPAETAVVDSRFETVLEHVIENAIVHNGDEPSVRVTVGETDDTAVTELWIDDDGPGIPETARKIITGEREITQLEHTTGIGLWVARWVIEAYGGELDFGTSDLGGTRVVLRLPSNARED
ncbi:PAS domain-containing protein [Natronomonas pharaonis]|uniref:PAS domain-containing protein n=1 Tax=Natronomonas pharaonis TaxID=2257 RepID=UPI000B1ACF3E|nr:PAS domain-containing protein [Natronomonas pharaonis]